MLIAVLLRVVVSRQIQVRAAIKECKKAGVRVCMITGDHSITAISIAQSIGAKPSLPKTGLALFDSLLLQSAVRFALCT